jgi:hypothetical protein
VLDYGYGTAGNLNDRLNRVEDPIQGEAQAAVAYTYGGTARYHYGSRLHPLSGSADNRQDRPPNFGAQSRPNCPNFGQLRAGVPDLPG